MTSCYKKVAKMRIPLMAIVVQLLIIDKTNGEDASPQQTNNTNPGFKFFFHTVGAEELFSKEKNKNQNGNPFSAWIGNQNANPFTPGIRNQAANPFTTFGNTNSALNFSSIGFGSNISDPGERPSADHGSEYEIYDDCEYSITTVNQQRVCRRQIIFDESFSSGISSKWQIEELISTYENNGGDLLFNYFDKDNVEVVGNALEITPKILDEEFIRRGTLKLNDCTGTTDDECERSARYHWILPPISSGRLNTKNSFSFKYGRVEVTAKVPVGDWLVPELWLLPKMEKYGSGLQSGRMEMSMARGNKALTSNGTDLGYQVLEAHLLMSAGEKIGSRTLRVKSAEPWHYHYHKYLFTWRPDEITVSVNDIIIGKLLEKRFSGTLANLAGFNHEEAKTWYQGSATAPFDEEFYISLGLSVGGRDFPDGSVSGYYVKPWKRRSVKEMTDFYSAKDKWAPTLRDEIAKLKILRVKVTSL